MDYPKTFEVFIYPKTFKLRNAVGEPPRYMFNCEMDHAAGRRKYHIRGTDKEDVAGFVAACLKATGRDDTKEFFVGNEIVEDKEC